MSIRKSTTFIALLILCLSFPSIHANKYDEDCLDAEQTVEDLVSVDESACHKSRKHNKAEIVLDRNKKLDFYVSISGGKVYSDNSETFVQGIKAIVEKAIYFADKRFGKGMAAWVIEKTFGIKKFNDKVGVNFQWLGSASLGYYAAENGRIDFEIMYSKVNIKDSNPKPIFDKSAGIFTFLLNFYYNPGIQNTQFAPYIGLGIGPTIFRSKMLDGKNKDLMPLNIPWFAYQVKLGVDYSITPEVKTFLGYRYFNIPLPIADHAATHNIEVGLLFNF